MEELQSRHRKELRDLQSRVTQKKKQASKKTRKAVNEECERLERELKERQEYEIREFSGEVVGDGDDGGEGVSGKLEELTLKVGGEEEAQEKTNGTEEPPSSQQDHTEQQPNGGAAKKRNRQKDRLARRAAEQEALAQQASLEAQSLPDLKSLERTRMLASMSAHHLSEIEIRADGHCLYSAVADQLKYLSIPISTTTTTTTESSEPSYKIIRTAAAEYISSHAGDFEPFLEEPLETYVHKIRDTAEWGGQLELLALAKTYGVEVCVLQDYGRVERIEGGDGQGGDGEGKKELWLGYYKHGFGLGEHYNSLRKKKKKQNPEKKEGG
ncbi:hypothetical protein M409DRAFT_36196 [Zasmidium cellare ATCC 36951]|uniref:OTU domain-containing protein n=1 Tax=Zasmidium cellare ATCC 36951 TaxID=1080233 RepID=A0A6A6CT65_ZASCE|nr:uncharacterized protein M409DRAFT_36196 [Zasmidium cellare ATCC 36951]KAF2169350.1 hypothetical protein M409DRAFT_36196 [Zasmidium cellare ATCC 36951]